MPNAEKDPSEGEDDFNCSDDDEEALDKILDFPANTDEEKVQEEMNDIIRRGEEEFSPVSLASDRSYHWQKKRSKSEIKAKPVDTSVVESEIKAVPKDTSLAKSEIMTEPADTSDKVVGGAQCKFESEGHAESEVSDFESDSEVDPDADYTPPKDVSSLSDTVEKIVKRNAEKIVSSCSMQAQSDDLD